MVLREGGKECLMLKWARDIGREKILILIAQCPKSRTRSMV